MLHKKKLNIIHVYINTGHTFTQTDKETLRNTHICTKKHRHNFMQRMTYTHIEIIRNKQKRYKTETEAHTHTHINSRKKPTNTHVYTIYTARERHNQGQAALKVAFNIAPILKTCLLKT